MADDVEPPGKPPSGPPAAAEDDDFRGLTVVRTDEDAARLARPPVYPAPEEESGGGLGGYIRRLFHIESGGDPYNRTGSNRGLGQFGPTEEHLYGINDANRHTPEAQASAVALERAHNDPTLTRVLGREPTDAEHYLAHQQGLAGANALLGNPDVPAWQAIRPYYRSDAIAQKAITGNIPGDSPLKRLNVNDISSAGFTAMWRDKFNRGQGEVADAGDKRRMDYLAYQDRQAPPPTAFMRAGHYIKTGDVSSGPSANVEDRRGETGPLMFRSRAYYDLHNFINRARTILDDPELSKQAGLPDIEDALKSDRYRNALEELGGFAEGQDQGFAAYRPPGERPAKITRTARTKSNI
jgi:hypothetical protein